MTTTAKKTKISWRIDVKTKFVKLAKDRCQNKLVRLVGVLDV